MTQIERIKALLRNGPVCSFADLYAAGMPNGRNRIGELRRQGWEIESRQCERDHGTDKTAHVEYVLRWWCDTHYAFGAVGVATCTKASDPTATYPDGVAHSTCWRRKWPGT